MPKWIVLYPKDANFADLSEEFVERRFNIIAADTKDLLEYLAEMPFVSKKGKDKRCTG